MKYYRTKLHEDYVDSYDSLNDEELEKEQDEELSKIIENSSIEVLLDNFSDIIEQSMGYLAELRSRNMYGPVCRKLCQNLYGHLSQIWMAVDNNDNQNAEFCIEYNKVSGRTSLLRKKPYDLYGGISTSVTMFSFEEFGEYLRQDTDVILRLSKQSKMYEDISLFYAEMKNIPENKNIMDDSHKKYKTIIESVALSKTEFVQAIYLRLLMISFCYKHWYKMFYNLNEKIGYEIITKAVDSIIDKIKPDIPRPISNNSKVNEDYVSSYDDIDDEELEKEQDEELSKIIEDAGVEVGFKNLLTSLESSMEYLDPPTRRNSADSKFTDLYDYEYENGNYCWAKSSRINVKERSNFCKSLYMALLEIHKIVDMKINYQDDKLYKIHKATSNKTYICRQTNEFGVPGWRPMVCFEFIANQYINVNSIISLYNIRYKEKYEIYSDIKTYWNDLCDIVSTASTKYTLSDKQLLQMLYLRLLIIGFGYRIHSTDYYINEKYADYVITDTVDYILHEIKHTIPRTTSYNTSKKVNEDYVNSYDSNEDNLPSMDDILKEAGDEFIFDSLKELFNDDSRQENLRKMLDCLYSSASAITIPNYNIRLNTQQTINAILNLIDGFYDVIKNKLKNSKKPNDNVVSIICYIQSTLANLTAGIIKTLFMFKESATNDNRFRGSTSIKSLIEKFFHDCYGKIKKQFIDPMINKLEELKRMAEV